MNLNRSTGLRQRSLNAVCRQCRKGRDEVRFPPLRPRLCLTCSPIELKDSKRPKKPRAGQNLPFLAYVRTQPCACKGRSCIGGMEAHHLRTAENSGTSIKPKDLGSVVSLCLGHHREYHAIGRDTFAAKYNVDLPLIAARLAMIYLATTPPSQV